MKPLDWFCNGVSIGILLCGTVGLLCCTKQETAQVVDATKAGLAIACAIEHAELSDAELDKLCAISGQLVDDVKPALEAHRKVTRARKTCKPEVKDAGAD